MGKCEFFYRLAGVLRELFGEKGLENFKYVRFLAKNAVLGGFCVAKRVQSGAKRVQNVTIFVPNGAKVVQNAAIFVQI